MEVSAEAKRIMVVALGKLYSSRTQRGGLRLHRSLLLSLVMKSARDIYHAAHAEPEIPTQMEVDPAEEPRAEADPADETGGEETGGESVVASRKRRGNTTAQPDFLPCKKAKLDEGSLPKRLSVNPVLLDYVTSCGGGGGGGGGGGLGLVSTPAPIPLHRSVAVC